jgi:hypothetical protein
MRIDWHREVFNSVYCLQGEVKADGEETIMRNAMLAILVLFAGGTAVIAGAAPAAAEYDYPWCVKGEELGASGDCSYRTLEQCRASASGRSTTYCGINKRVLFARQRAAQEQGVQPSRRQRRDY